MLPQDLFSVRLQLCLSFARCQKIKFLICKHPVTQSNLEGVAVAIKEYLRKQKFLPGRVGTKFMWVQVLQLQKMAIVYFKKNNDFAYLNTSQCVFLLTA